MLEAPYSMQFCFSWIKCVTQQSVHEAPGHTGVRGRWWDHIAVLAAMMVIDSLGESAHVFTCSLELVAGVEKLLQVFLVRPDPLEFLVLRSAVRRTPAST